MDVAGNAYYGSRNESVNDGGGFSKSFVNNKSVPLNHVSK